MLSPDLPIHLRQEGLFLGEDPPPAQFVPNPVAAPGLALGYPAAFRDRILLDTIHGGNVVPRAFRAAFGPGDAPLDQQPSLRDAYVEEKDWGANQVAERLAQKLGLAGYFRVNIARCLMDFGRFPGESPPDADHLSRLAISEFAARRLSYEDKRRLLQDCFDAISTAMEGHVRGKLIKIAVHTYDKRNRAGTVRPMVSLIYRPASYHAHNRVLWGVFDRMFPDHLAEFTADRRLIARIALELEKKSVSVEYNHPYLLPEGSVEFRAQVWFFFQFLKERFGEVHPDRVETDAYRRVWEMLQDTNLRSASAAALRSHMHRFLPVSPEQEAALRLTREAYADIAAFLETHHVADAYRRHPGRPTSLALEVRKDLIWRFEDEDCRRPVQGPEGAREENIEWLTDELARAIRIYLNEDRVPGPPPRV